jgi:hypothetical protein
MIIINSASGVNNETNRHAQSEGKKRESRNPTMNSLSKTVKRKKMFHKAEEIARGNAVIKTVLISIFILIAVAIPDSAYSADVIGIWTKTTHPDPENITIIYREKNDVKAVGFGQIGSNKAVWYAVGEFNGYPLRLYYHYSVETIPYEWEQEGTMILELSPDGNTLSGRATSTSGNWSGSLIFKRIK